MPTFPLTDYPIRCDRVYLGHVARAQRKNLNSRKVAMCPHFQAVSALLIALLAQTPSPPAKAQLPVPSRPTKTQPAVEAASDRVIRAVERINRIFRDSAFDPTLFPGS